MNPATHSPRLNIIGGGKLGRTLARLWHEHGQYHIGQILCQSPSSAQQSVHFVGAGTATSELSALESAEFWLIATPDNAIADTAAALAASGLIRRGDTVFHCSGALPAAILRPLADLGALTASIHPVHSFANPETSIRSFDGTRCACEGNSEALDKLIPTFERLGAQVLAIDGARKSLYHAGSVIACNYLVPLLDASLQCLHVAGLTQEDAAALLAPLVHGTADNVLQSTAREALTGPIARGDVDTVEKQVRALENELPELAPLYKVLGLATVAIAQSQDTTGLEAANTSNDSRTEKWQEIRALLQH